MTERAVPQHGLQGPAAAVAHPPAPSLILQVGITNLLHKVGSIRQLVPRLAVLALRNHLQHDA